MRIGKKRQLATVHPLRPRAGAPFSPALRTTDLRGARNVIDLTRARTRRRSLSNFNSPPDGTAA
jgi:hypothetical protein